MPIDASIPLGIQQPNGLQNLSSLVGLKTALQGQQIQQQQLQAAQMQNQQSSIDLQETQAAQGLLKNIKNYQDSQGNLDFNRLAPDLAAAAPKNFAAFMGPLVQVQKAHTEAQQSINSLDAQSRSQVGQIVYAMKGQPPEAINNTLDQLAKSYPSIKTGVDFAKQNMAPLLAGKNQKAIDDGLDTIGRMVVGAPEQQAMQTPGGVEVNDNATSGVVSTKPGTSVPVGQYLPGTKRVLQLPPTQQVVNDQGQPGVIGPHHASAPQDPGQTTSGVDEQISVMQGELQNPKLSADDKAAVSREIAGLQKKRTGMSGGGGFVPTALPPGQAANIQNNVDEMNRHFSGLQDQASGAQLVTGLTGNIKALADSAATGTGGGRKAFVDGLLSALHIPGSGDLQKDTDLLEKNMAQLNLGTPAGSDAARTLVAAARPHSSMNAGAIKDAADQVASQVQANMAMRNMLAPAKQMGDIQTYNAQRQKLEQIADPRVWQWHNLGPGTPAAKEFLSKLTPSDRASLGQKVQQLEQMGMLK